MKARLLVIAFLGAALVALPTAALGSAWHATSNSQSFPDSTGEDASAPDVTGVNVSNDDAGLISFHISVPNRPTFTSDMVFLLWIDTDSNAATGDPDLLGADYVVELDPGAVGLFKWNGSNNFDPAQSQTSVTFSYDATGPTIRVGAADLGGAKVANFVVEAISGLVIGANGDPDFTNAHADVAPDAGHGLFKYNVLTKLTLKQVAFATAPNPAKAGARFTATLAATESDTAGPVTKATVTCTASVKGVPLKATHALANGVASCFWKLPKTSKGKRVVGRISVTVQGTTLTKSFTAKIT